METRIQMLWPVTGNTGQMIMRCLRGHSSHTPLIPRGMWHERKTAEEVNGASERFGVFFSFSKTLNLLSEEIMRDRDIVLSLVVYLVV